MTRRVLPVLRPIEAVLPTVQARWIGVIGGAEVLPAEVDATCGDCAMVGPSESSGGIRFLPETRCCTYTPAMANFLVGGVLEGDPGSYGVRSMRARVRAGVGVSPLGVMGDPATNRAATEADQFGREASHRCPHLEGTSGRCGVWQHREATCATWFCKHTRGERSKAYWNRLQQLLQTLERAVALHCAQHLGIPPGGLALLVPLDARPGTVRADVAAPAHDPRQLWGSWADDPWGFFRACHHLAAGLSAEEVVTLGGAPATAMAAVVSRARAALDDHTLPPRLTLGRATVVGLGPASVRVQGYSNLDPLEVPRVLWDVLHCFEGQSTSEGLTRASEAAGQPVPPEAVAMLVDAGILREA